MAYTQLDGEPFRIWRAHPESEPASAAPPGQVLVSGAKLLVQTGDGALAITRVQQAGRKQVDAAEFSRGRDLSGVVLGE